MKYKIGTVAKLLALPGDPQALRAQRYSHLRAEGRGERLPVLQPAGHHRPFRGRRDHQYGFSMKETESLINTDDVDFVLEDVPGPHPGTGNLSRSSRPSAF